MQKTKKSDFLNPEIRSDSWKKNIKEFIEYLNETNDDQWCTDIVRSSDSSKNCLIGHFANYFNKGIEKDLTNQAFDWFENHVSTTFYIYRINDGKHPSYTQNTPRKRCIAFIEDILSGKELTTMESMDYHMSPLRPI